MRVEKRGVSDVIVTMLTIMLVLATVGIISTVVLKATGDANQNAEISTKCLDLDLTLQSCTITGNVATVLVHRGPGGADVVLQDIRLIFERSSNLPPISSIQTLNLPGALETKSYAFGPAPSVDTFLKVGIVPTIKAADGSTQQCGLSALKIDCT